jgi:hypothetical protein
MTKEDKDLLLRDLCARLPYGVKVICETEKSIFEVEAITSYRCVCPKDKNYLHNIDDDEIKPYLFPLSSMNEEQKYDFYCRFIENDCDFNDFKEFYLDNSMWHKLLTSLDDIEAIIDWFNKNHFDYRGFIPMGLAIDATNLNIY